MHLSSEMLDSDQAERFRSEIAMIYIYGSEWYHASQLIYVLMYFSHQPPIPRRILACEGSERTVMSE